jgi:U32 family peptidase
MIDSSKLELLAPAGDWEALRAAAANGADAVYFGLSAFNARARAANFTLDELPTVMQFLHDRSVKGFVAFNTLIFSNEIDDAVAFIEAIANAGVDAVIVQDLGLVALIHALAPSLAIHASTQMTLSESRGIEFVRRFGVERVVLARELSIEEIRTITASTSMPVEVFVHGALCVAYSGQCLTSEALGGRSANRGQCAQACRLPYEMLVDGKLTPLGDRAYLLSPQDLAAYDHIGELVEAGVISFKIEGRLKGGPYVAETTSVYRAAIDAVLREQPFALSRREQLDLAQVFSRGLTPGFLEGNDHQRLVRGRFPKSRGIVLGTVISVGPKGVRVRLADVMPDMVRAGDGVLFDIGHPDTNEPGGRVWHVNGLGDAMVELGFDPASDIPSRVPIGCTVFKTDDPTLRKRLESSYTSDEPRRRMSVQAAITGRVGESVTVRYTLEGTDSSAAATWAGPLEIATKRPTTADEIQSALARLGDTPFELSSVKNDLPSNVMMPKSVLNDLRRQAIAELQSHPSRRRSHAFQPVAKSIRGGWQAAAAISNPALDTPRLTILCRTIDQVKASLLLKPDAIDCDFEDLKRYKDAVALCRDGGVPVGLAPLRIWKPGEDGMQAVVARAAPDRVLIRNLASISFYREALPTATLVGDFSLNVANDITAGILIDSGLSTLVPSFDLNWDQFTALMINSHPQRFEVVVHQHMPMFHMEHCVFAAFLSTGKDHRDCGRPCDRHAVKLRDRVGAEFPVRPDTGCRNTVLNSVPQSAAEYIPRMLTLGVRRFRIDLLEETAAAVAPLVDRYRAVIAGHDDGRQAWKHLRALNQLGVTRGTMSLA